MKGKLELSAADYITMVRMAGAVGLLFLAPLSPAFFLVHTLCGLGDVLDGLVARATKRESELGAKLDSVADLLFYTVVLSRLLPTLWARLPRGIWYGVGAVLLLRLISYGTAAAKYRRFASLHTYLNKLSGVAVFAVPYILLLPCARPLCAATCVVAGIASVEELLIHLRQKDYRPDVKTILRCKKPM